MRQSKQVLYDLALTIEVHPLALGVIPESNGQVAMLDGVFLTATIITDIIGYHSETPPLPRYEKRTRFDAGQTRAIPPLVKDLKVVTEKKKKVQLGAVLVVEHRNLKKVMTDNDYVSGSVILVMVSQILRDPIIPY